LGRRFASAAAAVAVAITALIVLATPALAICTFSFQPSTYQVNEGVGSVTITVVRDNTAAAAVRARTVNGSATEGQDYTAVNIQIFFMTGTLQRSFDVPILDDNIVEGQEQFTVELSDGACSANPAGSYVPPDSYGDPAKVTIIDDDTSGGDGTQPGTGGAGGIQPGTGGGGETQPGTSGASPAATLDNQATPGDGLTGDDIPDTEDTDDAGLAGDEEGGGVSAVPIIGAIAMVIAGVAGVGLLWRRRRAASA
jgi:hypothetical protein